MAALGVWLALAVTISTLHLFTTANTEPDFELGTVFDIEDLSNPFKQLGKRGCLPKNFSIGAGNVPLIKECVSKVKNMDADCTNIPRIGCYFQCLTERLNVTSGNRLDAAGFVSLISSFAPDIAWRNRVGRLALQCITASDPAACSGLRGSQQSVSVFACWRWSQALDCDLGEAIPRTPAASCRRGRFLGGACRLSPGALLKPVTAWRSADEEVSRWETCLEEIRNMSGVDALLTDLEKAAAEVTGDQCLLLDSAMEHFVSCLMREFIDSSSRGGGESVDFSRLQRAAIERGKDMQDTMALLEIVDWCQRSTTLQEFFVCWTERAIHSCATEEANQVARKS